jgi:isopenicillin-N epimerase
VNNEANVWRLDPEVINLNAGGLGSCPTPVLEAQARWREQMERRPHEFLLRELEGHMLKVREALGRFVGSDPDHLAMVPNATAGVNAVLRSLDFRPGDELLTTSHEYNGCLNALDYVASRAGATIVRAPIPFPIEDPEQVTAAVLAGVTKRTRLAMISHITSATALVFPIEEIVSELNQMGVDVLIDGAHAPGLVDLELDWLGAAYYSGNCHKWLCGPKGTGFLHVRKDKQPLIHPLVIGFRANDPRTDISQFRKEFDWPGVYDPTGFLSIPDALDFLEDLAPGGLRGLAARNRGLALEARDRLCPIFEIEPPAPDSMLTAMVALPLDHLIPEPDRRPQLGIQLRERYRIEVPILRWRPRPNTESGVIRISCQAFNDRSDIEALAHGMTELLGGGMSDARRRT